MLIRRNTKAFKTILEIVTACRDRADRESLIRLYITRAGDSIGQRIAIEGIQGDASLFYDMTYQSVVSNLRSPDHQLYQSDETPGIYYFHSTSNKVWDETPFEFDEALKKMFAFLPELPVFRKREKADKFILPPPKVKSEPEKKTKAKRDTKKEDKSKQKAKRAGKVVDLWPKQPDYKLRHDIHFSALDRIVYRQPQLAKRDVLDYYDRIADFLLPYLKDRPQLIRLQRDGQGAITNANLESLKENSSRDIPSWFKTAPGTRDNEQILLCNDKEHLLYYVEMGCFEFYPAHSRIRSIDSPDYLVVQIESPDYELGKAIEVALAGQTVLAGLKLPSFVKTDGASGLHIYIPLDTKSGFEAARNAAAYIGRLIQVKVRDRVTLRGSQEDVYGKVALDCTLNEEGKAVIAPYSLVTGSSPIVAAPLRWDEVEEGLKAESFHYDTIFSRLKEEGDLFDGLFRKKVNADVLLEMLRERYGFLFEP